MAESTPRREHFGEPFFLQWNITDRCNLECAHCYRDTPIAELDRERLLGVLASFSEFLEGEGKQGRVMLSGGEPLTSPHLFELAEEARRRDLPVRVLSNGTLIDGHAARSLAEVGVRTVQVSIEGTRPTHDSIRGAGSYEAALDGIAALRESDIEVTLAMTLSARNLRELPAVTRLAAKVADRFHVARHVPIGRGQALDSDSLTAEQLEAALRWLDERRRSLARRGTAVSTRDPLWKALRTVGPCEHCVSGCSIGYNGVCVDADGATYPCRRLPIELGNITETPLAELWRHPALDALRDRDRLEGRCGACDIRWVCGGCRAVAAAASGYPLAEDPQCFRPLPAG